MTSEANNDKTVAEAWQSTQDLRAPESLNDAVLAEARKAAAAGKHKASWPWLKPMAFAATLLFGIFLVYDTQLPYEAPVSPARQQGLSDDALPELRPNPQAEAIAPPAELEERRNEQASTPAPAAVLRATPADVEAARERKSESDRARTQFKASEESAETALDGLRDTTNDRSTGSRAQSPPAAAPELAASESLSAEPGCSGAQRRDVTLWWACVAELQGAGHAEAAAAEKQSLLAAFPDFTVPE